VYVFCVLLKSFNTGTSGYGTVSENGGMNSKDVASDISAALCTADGQTRSISVAFVEKLLYPTSLCASRQTK
jgi:hypothetical protein